MKLIQILYKIRDSGGVRKLLVQRLSGREDFTVLTTSSRE